MAEVDERLFRSDALLCMPGQEARRARFAEDPAALALAMALTVRDPSVELRTDIGTPRSLISKLSTRFGKDPDRDAYIAALSRAIGLWDHSAVSVA